MFSLFNTPSWFNDYDLVFNVITFLITFLVTAYSYKIYKISKERKYAYFSLSFLLISFAFILKIVLLAVSSYSSPNQLADYTLSPITGGSVVYGDLLYRAAYFLHMASTLGAWLLIFFISQKSRARLSKFYEVAQIALFIYLITLISVVSSFKYTVFYLTAAVILGMIVLNYYKNYLNKKRNMNAFLVMVAFLLILLGQFFFIFVFISNTLYLFGELSLLIGFLLIFYVYRKVVNK
jgi:hypothetical protein